MGVRDLSTVLHQEGRKDIIAVMESLDVLEEQLQEVSYSYKRLSSEPHKLKRLLSGTEP